MRRPTKGTGNMSRDLQRGLKTQYQTTYKQRKAIRRAHWEAKHGPIPTTYKPIPKEMDFKP